MSGQYKQRVNERSSLSLRLFWKTLTICYAYVKYLLYFTILILIDSKYEVIYVMAI